MAILIFGCGYLGIRVARRLLAQGQVVYAVTRTADRAAQLQAEGIVPIIGNWLDADLAQRLPATSHLLVAVSHRTVDGIPAEQTHTRGLETWLLSRHRNDTASHVPFEQLVYISTTGVYSNSDAAWTDESTPASPKRPGGIAARSAELWLEQNRAKTSYTILRMAGLYGPGRIPSLQDKSIRPQGIDEPQQAPVLAIAEESFLNLIHIDDAAAITVEALLSPPPENLYLVSDGNPVTRREYYRYCAAQQGLPPPIFVEPSVETPTPSRAEASKRINTARLRRDFHHQFIYPDYLAGLAAC